MSESKDSVKRRIIGLYSPEPQSGKSTIAQRLYEEHGFGRVSLAAPVKEMVGVLLCNLGYGAEDQIEMLNGDRKGEILPGIEVTPRAMMQTLGTEWGRELVREDLWTRVAKANIDRIAPDASFVIDDVRFPDEAEMIRAMGGEVVRVLRPERPEPTDGAVLKHASEGGLDDWPFDNTLFCPEGIEALHHMADSLMEEAKSTEIATEGWQETFSGKMVNVTSPDPTAIHITDISHALSLQCRYNGHCSKFYSVAEHCILVEKFLWCKSRSDRLRRLGLLHDAAEAYVGDVVRGVKGQLNAYDAIEAGVMAAIYTAFGIDPPTDDEHAVIKEADNAILLAEAKVLMKSKGEGWGIDGPAAELTVCCLSPEAAEREFLSRWGGLWRAP